MNNLSILGIFVADLAFFGKIPKVGETILGKAVSYTHLTLPTKA